MALWLLHLIDILLCHGDSPATKAVLPQICKGSVTFQAFENVPVCQVVCPIEVVCRMTIGSRTLGTASTALRVVV